MVGRPTSQPRETFSQPAHLLSVTEVNSQVVGEVFLDMRFEGQGCDWTFAVPRLTPPLWVLWCEAGQQAAVRILCEGQILLSWYLQWNLKI